MKPPPIRIDGEGRFAGYASLYGTLDQGGDIVMPGAFARSLAQRPAEAVRLLFQHDPKEPIGIWESIAEDSRGLKVTGRLLEGVPRAKSLAALVAQGGIDGLSIGFRTERATREARTGHRKLWRLALWEISIVTFPMLEAARIGAPVQPATLAASLGAATRILRNRQRTSS